MKLVLPHPVATTRVVFVACTLAWMFYMLLAARPVVEGILSGMNASIVQP